jgi:hypothetical protein
VVFGTVRTSLAIGVGAFFAIAWPAQAQKAKNAAPPSEELSQILSWLPADTETVIVANGPFSFPDLSPRDAEQLPPPVESVDDLKEDFEAMPLGLLGFKTDLLANRLQGQKVTFAIEGARHFGNPEGLGGAPFEGCSIAVFVRDVSDRTAAFLTDSAKAALPPEQIEDQKVAVFQQHWETDMWTIFVAFPKPNIALACSSRDYLREVLVRMHGARGAMALPDQLPEWKYIDTHVRFWGFRHFAKAQANDDPTSPFGGDELAASQQDKAIGITFRFDPNKSRTATVTYFSSDKDAVRKVKDGELSGGNEPAANDLKIEYSELAPGFVAITYDLESPQSVNLFLFLLAASLGHTVVL